MPEGYSHAIVLRLFAEKPENEEDPIEWRAILEDPSSTGNRYPIMDMQPVYDLLGPHWEDFKIEGDPPATGAADEW